MLAKFNVNERQHKKYIRIEWVWTIFSWFHKLSRTNTMLCCCYTNRVRYDTNSKTATAKAIKPQSKIPSVHINEMKIRIYRSGWNVFFFFYVFVDVFCEFPRMQIGNQLISEAKIPKSDQNTVGKKSRSKSTTTPRNYRNNFWKEMNLTQKTATKITNKKTAHITNKQINRRKNTVKQEKKKKQTNLFTKVDSPFYTD